MNENNQFVRFDWAIKNILKFSYNYSILEGFISTILGQKIQVVNIFREASRLEEEYGNSFRLTILAQNGSEELILVELQNQNSIAYYDKALLGTSKFIADCTHMNSFTSYIHHIYSINIVYFPLGHNKDWLYYGKDSIRGVHNNELFNFAPFMKQEFDILSDSCLYPEFYVLYVPDFEQTSNNPLEQWAYYLKTGEVPVDANAMGLQEVRKQLNMDYFNEKGPAILLVTHYQRLLDYIKPNFVHVMMDGKIIKSGDASLVKIIEEEGYDKIKESSTNAVEGK